MILGLLGLASMILLIAVAVGYALPETWEPGSRNTRDSGSPEPELDTEGKIR